MHLPWLARSTCSIKPCRSEATDTAVVMAAKLAEHQLTTQLSAAVAGGAQRSWRSRHATASHSHQDNRSAGVSGLGHTSASVLAANAARDDTAGSRHNNQPATRRRVCSILQRTTRPVGARDSSGYARGSAHAVARIKTGCSSFRIQWEGGSVGGRLNTCAISQILFISQTPSDLK